MRPRISIRACSSVGPSVGNAFAKNARKSFYQPNSIIAFQCIRTHPWPLGFVWLLPIIKFINNYPGNKSDLGSIERVIDESEGKKTAETWNASFIEASAKIPGGSKVLRLEGPPRYPS